MVRARVCATLVHLERQNGGAITWEAVEMLAEVGHEHVLSCQQHVQRRHTRLPFFNFQLFRNCLAGRRVAPVVVQDLLLPQLQVGVVGCPGSVDRSLACHSTCPKSDTENPKHTLRIRFGARFFVVRMLIFLR